MVPSALRLATQTSTVEVTRWPNSLKVWEDHSAGVPEDQKHKMVVQNAVDFFRLDG